MSSMLRCLLFIDGMAVGEPLSALYNGTIFFPDLPITLGQITNSQDDVVGITLLLIKGLCILMLL